MVERPAVWRLRTSPVFPGNMHPTALSFWAINAWDEDKGVLRRMVRKQRLTHTILVNGSRVASQYGSPGTPTHLWIDRAGVIRETEVGYGGASSLERRTIQLLKTNAKD